MLYEHKDYSELTNDELNAKIQYRIDITRVDRADFCESRDACAEVLKDLSFNAGNIFAMELRKQDVSSWAHHYMAVEPRIVAECILNTLVQLKAYDDHCVANPERWG